MKKSTKDFVNPPYFGISPVLCSKNKLKMTIQQLESEICNKMANNIQPPHQLKKEKHSLNLAKL